MANTCTVCQKGPPTVTLKFCAKCATTPYCSRDCQKADWKTHKKVCGKPTQHQSDSGSGSGSAANNNSPPRGVPTTGLAQPSAVPKPFTRLGQGTWLHGRPEQDVYRLLIDSYRLRAEDNFNFEGDSPADSLYGGASSALRGFQRFLELAESRAGLLPSWWSEEKKRECEEFGSGGSEEGRFQDLRRRVDKGQIQDVYGDSYFPMQLRMLAEVVYGRGVGGQRGETMRMMLASQE
ncbi:uncharacterized protein C8A04DRAFT_31296 [Dichotomopilus funicola]|uniref:MYND-type domain-containing protein n=1 Tax=Dichotomopilus funicola TaxID=1934379 RepID=A0AAN6UXW4_9PEZI|nr:hypothetical protein C8A04DRAFT_31296 [Dichotomopilus funicola]